MNEHADVASASNCIGRIATVVLLLTCAACGGPDSGAELDRPANGRYGGSLVIGIPADIQSVNPLTSSDANSSLVRNHMLFMTLLRLDSELEPQPYLAESWDTVRVAPDSIDLTFHLRDDVLWHDGQPTTAEDVLFTFERAIDPETAYPNRSQFDRWSPNAELIDEHTIRFRFRPHSDFLVVWSGLEIVPEHLLADVAPIDFARHPFGFTEPVGNGPFTFLRRLPNQEWVFTANESFPEDLGGRPFLDRVTFRVIPEASTLMTELLTGGIDVYPDPTPSRVPELRASAGVQIVSSPYRAYTYIGWNTRRPMFADARVRRALSMAVDRRELVEALLYGQGEVGISTSTPAHWAYPIQARLEAPYDPEGATELLAEVGWVDRDGDGTLENRAGEPFEFQLITNQGNDLRRDVGEVVQAQFTEIGVRANFRTLEWNTLISILDGSINANGVRERDFDAVISGWVNDIRKDDTPILHSRNLNDPFQETGISNPRLDALLDTLNYVMDRDDADPLWEEYHRLLLDEAPYAVLYYPNVRLAHRDRIRGVTLDARGTLATISNWWIEE